MTDTTTNDKTPRAAVAKHELLNASGEVVKRMEEATGIRYTVIASGEKFEYQLPDATPGSAATMLALFGAKTKATNEASRVRQDNGSAAEQLEAIDDVFEQLTGGVWRERSEGGGGSRTDKRLLAEVLVELLGTKAQGTVDTYHARLEEDKDYTRKVMSNDAIKAEYRKRAGKTGPAIDTLV